MRSASGRAPVDLGTAASATLEPSLGEQRGGKRQKFLSAYHPIESTAYSAPRADIINRVAELAKLCPLSIGPANQGR